MSSATEENKWICYIRIRWMSVKIKGVLKAVAGAIKENKCKRGYIRRFFIVICTKVVLCTEEATDAASS
jgi:hypothetical protein